MPLSPAPDTFQIAGRPNFRRLIEQGREAMRYRAVERWVARRLRTVDHERRVADISTTLFDLTWPLHRLGADALHLLRLAAVVHDVGRSIDDETHPEEGARMLLAEPHLPLSTSERRLLAYMTRYHRGTVPEERDDEVLLRGDDAGRMRMLLAHLRAADALDNRSLQSPRLVFALVGLAPRRELRVTCYLDTDSAKARRVYRRRKKFRLIEEMLDLHVAIEVSVAQALRMVA